MRSEKLAYDVGMHNGADTAVYLSRGYNVVAVEANPLLVSQAEERFASYIAAGRLRIVNAGIAASSGKGTFWVCDDILEWSSFDRTIASREGAKHHPIRIDTVPFSEILRQHGMPHYCKIDIEGHDRYCLQAFTADYKPPYVSVELSCGMMTLLERLAYQRFKIVDQARAFCAVEPMVYRMTDSLGRIGPIARRIDIRLRGRRDLPFGSSGPPGPETAGRWLSAEKARRVHDWTLRTQFDDGFARWFDIHAAM